MYVKKDEERWAVVYLSFVVANGGVHFLLVDVFNLGCGAAQDALLLLFGQ